MAIILGTTRSETINGTVGNDTIDGKGGSDFIDGGAGIDTTVFFGNHSDFSVIDLSGVVRITGLSTAPRTPTFYPDRVTKVLNVENVQFIDTIVELTTPTNEIIFGTTRSETINGTTGNDTIDGNGGSDFIDGGAGIDTVVFFGNSSDFSVIDLGGVVRVTGLSTAPRTPTFYPDRTTELRNIEKVQFLDETKILDSNIITQPSTDDYSNSINTTGTIAVGGAIAGNIETVGDADWFKVTLEGGHRYQFDLEGDATSLGTLADPFIRLRDDAGTPAPLAFDDDSGIGLNSSFVFNVATTGTYFLAVGSGADDGTGVGNYKMSVTDALGGTGTTSTGFSFPLGNLDAQGHRSATEVKDGDGFYVTGNFGDDESELTKSEVLDYHLGEDWNFESKADLGAPVYAVADGTVIWAGSGGSGWGNVVIIKHPLPNGEHGGFVTSMYGHLGNLSVFKNSSVSIGDPIGVIGSPETISTGSHLHLEIRAGTNPDALVVGAGYSETPRPLGWLDPTDFINDHLPSITAPPPSSDRLFNWAESTYDSLFPNHPASQEIFGFYARIYENGNALGEQDDNIYYYDGNSINLVGTINDFLSDAILAGF